MTKQDILEFIKQHDLAVIATVDQSGIPQAAVVEFAELDDLTIVIDTLITSRKYKNLQIYKEVAIVIGWDKNVTVQINATATELSGDDLAAAKKAYFAKNNRAKKWQSRPDISYFGFKPKWVRYSDVGKEPWKIEELSF
jgi:pyridoxine/pyridoxamine 5'-phosphate oxidase